MLLLLPHVTSYFEPVEVPNLPIVLKGLESTQKGLFRVLKVPIIDKPLSSKLLGGT